MMKWIIVMSLSRSNEQGASHELTGRGRCERKDTWQKQVLP